MLALHQGGEGEEEGEEEGGEEGDAGRRRTKMVCETKMNLYYIH